MQESTFHRIAEIALRETGQQLSPAKAYLIEARLSAICRRENLTELDDLVHCLDARPNPRFEAEIAAALTSKLTSFFSDKDQFERLVTHALPERLKASSTGRIRLLSCGVGTGQEAYSVAMRLSEAADTPLGKAQIEIVAIDISPPALATAEAGLYNHFQIQKGLSVQRMMAHFTRQDSGDWQISDALRNAIEFRKHNLLDSAAPLGQFDVILCRNVLPAMAQDAQVSVLNNLLAQLLPEGLLFVADGESLVGLSDQIEPSRAVRGAYAQGPTPSVSGEIAVA